MLEYIQLRSAGHSIIDSAVEGAVLGLQPIMMTMLVATFGLLPAAMSHRRHWFGLAAAVSFVFALNSGETTPCRRSSVVILCWKAAATSLKVLRGARVGLSLSYGGPSGGAN